MGIGISIFSKHLMIEVCFHCGNYINEEYVYCYDNKHCSLQCAEKTIRNMEKCASHVEIHNEVARLSPIPAPMEESIVIFDAVELDS